MSEFSEVIVLLFMWVQGLILGYIIWAPMTRFKQAFIDGVTFRFLWDKSK
jgi:hypothetical protein